MWFIFKSRHAQNSGKLLALGSTLFIFLKSRQTQNLHQCTEMRFASFLSGGFITAIVVNPPERKLAKRTSVDCGVAEAQQCFAFI